MRSSAGRIDKYSKKLRSLILPGQTARYAPTAQDRIHLEYCVKREAITPMLQFSYVAFCEELIKHEANKRPEEGLGIYNKWLNRGLDATILQSVASCIGVSIEVPAPPLCAWDWKRKLTFTGNVSATNLDNFPILVHLTNANFDFNKARNNGEDIRFMDSDTCPADGTPLKHEIELWDKPGANAWVWVKVPRIDGGSIIDFIYLFYGNNAAPDGQDPPNVWDGNFKLVLHMRAPTGTNLPDSTSLSNDYTKKAVGEPAHTTDGQINSAQLFDGANDFANRPWDSDFHLGDPAASLTIEFWVKCSAQPHDNVVYLTRRAPPKGRYFVGILAAGRTKPRFDILDINAVTCSISGNTSVTDNQYHYVVAMYDNINHQVRIYRNGNADGAAVACNLGEVNPNSESLVGASTSIPNDLFTGKIDEVRVSIGIARSADWIKAQYKSMVETLITYGAEEPAG